MGHAPVFIQKSELNVNRLSVEHSVNLLVCPAEHLLVEVPEINTNRTPTTMLNSLTDFLQNLHISVSPF